jgi:hypothetical protein
MENILAAKKVIENYRVYRAGETLRFAGREKLSPP